MAVGDSITIGVVSEPSELGLRGVRHSSARCNVVWRTWSSSTCSSASVTLAWGKYALLSTCASCFDAGELGLASGPNPHSHGNTCAVNSPCKRVAIGWTFGKGIHEALCVRFLNPQ
jgi:hypothetical protein